MDREHYERLDAILVEALDLPRDERAAFLDRACDGDAVVQRDVERLLVAADTTAFDQPAAVLLGAPETVSTQPLPTFQCPPLSGYEIRRELGAGSFGVVYECYDIGGERSVAVKVLRDLRSLDRFKQEFRRLVAIHHPHLVRLYELKYEAGTWFFSMELVDGPNFLDYVRLADAIDASDIACDIDRLREASRQLASAIAALHKHALVHRDIKPENIKMSKDASVRLLDFGLARDVSANDHSRWTFAGTLPYMAPEQLAGAPVSAASDWFAFGVVLFESLVGRTPNRLFGTSPSDGGERSPSGVVAGVPPDLDALCADLLQVKPDRRPSADDVLRRLGAPAPPRASDIRDDTVEAAPIGREAQLERLNELLNLAQHRHPVVVKLHGRSGMGKTTLMRAFLAQTRRLDPSVLVFEARCYERQTVPFKALDDLVDAIAKHLQHLPQHERDAVLPSHFCHLQSIFPVLLTIPDIRRLPGTGADVIDPQEVRERAFAGLKDLLSRLADRRLTILAVDDLQWGDLDSAAVLDYLLAFPAPALMLVGCYRTEDSNTSAFLRGWATHQRRNHATSVHEIEVGPLAAADAQKLARHILVQRGAGDERAPAIAEAAHGDPMLIGQFAKYAASTDDAHLTVRALITRRMGELPEIARQLMQIVSIALLPLPFDVVRDATAVDGDLDSVASLLIDEHLLRQTDGRLEVYHDQIRESVVEAIPADALRRLHKRLAEALERRNGSTPAALAVHLREAGDIDRAAGYSVQAGEQALVGLAFDAAARWFQMAIDLGRWDQSGLEKLRRQLAMAFARDGRGVSAAEVYLDAARLATGPSRRELERLAADQLLRVGHISRGIEILRGVAAQLGIRLAEQPWHAVISLGWHRSVSALRQAVEPPARTPATSALERLDTYWSLAVGLGFVDAVRSADFHARHLALALRVAEPTRLGMSLALEATHACGARGTITPSTRDLFAKGRSLIDAAATPHALGFVKTMEATAAVLASEWPAARTAAQDASEFLRTRCSGATWELASAHNLEATADIWLGKWARVVEHTDRLPSILEQARSRDDRFATYAELTSAPIGALAMDMPERIEEIVRESVAHVPTDGFYLPQLVGMLSRAEAALYRRDPVSAWAILDAHWPRAERSLLLRVKYLQIFALTYRGRICLAAAAAGIDSKVFLGRARRTADRLARIRTAWARASCLLVRAGVCSIEHTPDAALGLIEQAERAFDALHMAHFRAACQFRRGILVGGDAGRVLVAEAEHWAHVEGIVKPRAVLEMLATGAWPAP